MVEQDYIMRLVHEIARMLAKILFNINSETLEEDLEDRIEDIDVLERLLNMIDEGHINEAENKLYDILNCEYSNCIEIALLFYSHLNDKTDEFLSEHNYSRSEIKYGMESVAEHVGLSSLVSSIFEEY